MSAVPASPSRSSGFSLVETLVCLALLAGAATAVAAVTLRSVRSVERTARMTEALTHATTVMDLLQQAPSGHPWLVPGGDTARPLTGAGTWFVDVGDLQVRWRVIGLTASGDLLALDVAVVRRGSPSGHPPLARLRGVRGD